MGSEYSWNLNDFVFTLRRYKKNDIINVSSRLLWDMFSNRENYSTERTHIVNAYAPHLIMLALATTNNYRNTTLTEISIVNLCNDYLGIRESISNKAFMDDESKDIAFALIALHSRKSVGQMFMM